MAAATPRPASPPRWRKRPDPIRPRAAAIRPARISVLDNPMTQLFILAVLLCAVAALSAFGTWKMIGWAHRRNMLDTPNHRSSHTQHTARDGGVALVAAFSAGTAA